MKILHTSDWHLGHTLYNYDRKEEQEDMIHQMVDIARKEQPDAFLLSGDVYDIAQPSAAAQQMFSNAMAQLHQAVPGMTIIVTAGNHDSGMRTEAFQSLLSMVDIHTIGTIDKTHPENHIIPINGKGFVIALPYTADRFIPEGFYDLIEEKVNEQNTDGLPVVMMAHTTVKNADFRGHKSSNDDTIIGGIESVGLETFGNGYDYLALGHIHRPQTFEVKDSNQLARYCGTPIATSFDEDTNTTPLLSDGRETDSPPLQGERLRVGDGTSGMGCLKGGVGSERLDTPPLGSHSVSIVEIEARGEKPKVRLEDISNPHPLVTLPANGPLPWDEVKEIFDKYPSDLQAYIRLNVAVTDSLPSSAYAEAQEIAKGKACRYCLINAVRQEDVAKTNSRQQMELSEFQRMDPLDILKRFYHDKKGLDLPEHLEKLFNEAVQELNEESRES